MSNQNWGSKSGTICDGRLLRRTLSDWQRAGGQATCRVASRDVRYSLLCVHWAQCKGALTRAGIARPRSPAAPTWTFTCARIQASGPISATPVSSASRRSPASIYINGRTQVGDSRGPDWPPARPQPFTHFGLSSKSLSFFLFRSLSIQSNNVALTNRVRKDLERS